jgi:tripartite ATP-independent transporter DctM subunit
MLAWSTAGLLGAFALAVPIGVALCLLGIVGVYVAGVPLSIVAQRMSFGLDNYSLVAVPLFLLMGNLMNATGITKRLFAFAEVMVGHWRGGLAQVNVLASLCFAGMSGSALADAAGLGTVEIRAMREAGYKPGYAAAITAASSTIGPVFPPSITAVLYAYIANVSVGRMFLAGVIPAIMMTVALMIVVRLQAAGGALPSRPRATGRERRSATVNAILALITPILLIGGMRSGLFTPTEVAGVAVLYSVLLGIIYREVRWRDMVETCRATVITTGAIMIIVAGANVFAWILARQEVPQGLTELVLRLGLAPWQLLLILNIALLILGMLIDTAGILILVTPVVVPALASAGIDPVHFGVVMIVNMMIGLLTPPVGLALFVVSDIAKVPFATVARATLPYVGALIIVLLLITYIPQLVLFLPDLVFGVSK